MWTPALPLMFPLTSPLTLTSISCYAVWLVWIVMNLQIDRSLYTELCRDLTFLYFCPHRSFLDPLLSDPHICWNAVVSPWVCTRPVHVHWRSWSVEAGAVVQRYSVIKQTFIISKLHTWGLISNRSNAGSRRLKVSYSSHIGNQDVDLDP